MRKFRSLVIFFLILMVACQKEDEPALETFDPSKDKIVMPKKEIRAAWIATVYNLDWPLTKGDPSAQKAELIRELDYCRDMNFNAVIFQIRPMADAFYPSALEPWSQFLTGTQGTDPGYDPLQFAIEEAHKRGMELHGWLNPYRIGPVSNALAPGHVAVLHPEWVVTFGDARYFNPGIPGAAEHLKNVVKDIITRYDVDAIHFDDYFYPAGAKSVTNPFTFDDKTAWENYGQGKDVHTWRADNVNRMVSDISQLIHSVKPGILFGISPSGRRENSLDLYADPLVWLNNKWVDYLAPQIYWEIGHPTADFATLAAYWNGNSHDVPMIIGIASYKFRDALYPAYSSVSQFDRQIDLVRNSTYLSGCFFFREKFLENPELFSWMKTKFSYMSVLPFMGTPTVATPAAPALSVNGKVISWQQVSNSVNYAVYLLERDNTRKNSFNANCVQIVTDLKFTAEPGRSYFVTAVNKDNAESEPSTVVMVK